MTTNLMFGKGHCTIVARTMASGKEPAQPLVKSCCRVCRKAVHHKDRKVFFSVIGLRNRITERL